MKKIILLPLLLISFFAIAQSPVNVTQPQKFLKYIIVNGSIKTDSAMASTDSSTRVSNTKWQKQNFAPITGGGYVPYTYLGWTSVSKFGGDTTGTTDALTAARAALASKDAVYFQQGTYLISDSLVIRSGQRVYFDNARIIFTGTGTLFAMKGLTKASIAGKLTITGNGNVSGTQVGVRVSGGNSNDISGITFTNISGIAYLNSNYNTTNFTRGNSAIVHDCFFVGNYVGVQNSPRSPDGVEYSTYSNCNFRSNTFPIKTYAGNQKFIGLNVIDNINGIYVDGSGGNAAHDTWTACNISHNTNYNAYLTGITLGESFDNCNLYGGASNGITLINSVGISFTAGSIDGILDVDATSLVTLTGVKQASVAFTIPNNPSRVTQTGNFTLTGPVNETNKLQIGSVVGNAGTMIFNNTPTTGYVKINDVSNTSGHFLSGIEGSVAGTVATGTAAYTPFIGSTSNTKFQILANNSVWMTLDPAQTLSGTGVIFGSNASLRSAAVELSENTTALKPGFATSFILNRSANTSSALLGFVAGEHLGSAFAANVTNTTSGLLGFYSNQTIDAGATGTVSSGVGFRNAFVNNSAMNITNLSGAKFEAPINSGGGTITSNMGVGIDNLTNATNNTLLRLGAVTTVAGNWGEYNSSTYANYIAGKVQLGATLATAGAPQLDVTGSIGSTALTASKLVFTDANKVLTSTGIGTSSQFLMADGSLNSNSYASLSGAAFTGRTTVTASVSGNTAVDIVNSNASGFGLFVQGGTTTNYALKVVNNSGTQAMAVLGNGNTTIAGVVSASNLSGTNTGDQTTSSANSDISVATGSGNPVLTFNRVLANGVTATTQSAGDNSTKVATTAYADAIKTSTLITPVNTYTTSATPSIAVNAAAGTGATASIVGNNQDGTITFTTGTGASVGTLVTITMSGSFSYPTICVPVISINQNTSAYPSTTLTELGVAGTSTTFTITSNFNPLAASTTYKFNYHNGGY